MGEIYSADHGGILMDSIHMATPAAEGASFQMLACLVHGDSFFSDLLPLGSIYKLKLDVQHGRLKDHVVSPIGTRRYADDKDLLELHRPR